MWLFILSTNVLPPIISGSEVLSKIHSKLLCPCIGFKTADWAQTFISTFLKVLISFIKKLLRIINDKSVIGIKRGTWYVVSTRKSIQNWIHNESKCFNIPGGGLVTKLCPTLVIPWTVAHRVPLSMGILQARTLECVAIPFPRGSSPPRDQTQVSCIAGKFFTTEPPGK